MVYKINRINKLNQKAELQKLEKIPDGAGGFGVNWIKVKNVWIDIKLISNSINNKYNMLEIKATHVITIRKLNNIDKNVRFVCNDGVFVVKYVGEVVGGFVEVVCEKLNFENI